MGKLEQLSFKGGKAPGIRRLLVFSACVMIAAMAVLLAGFAYIYHITPPDSQGTLVDSIRFMVKPGEAAFQGKETMNILCLGVDNNYTDQNIMYTKGARTDTIFVISIDAKAEAVNVLSIPRDTWIEISAEHGFDKINAAYSIGGVEGAKRTIGRFLGIKIDHYVVLKVKSTENMVNALGGIEVEVEKDMDYDDNWGHLHVHLKKGPQLLDGQKAVGYARFRHDEESDWGRIRRQQQVMNALLKELKKPSNVLRIEKIVKVIKESVETDMSMPQLLDLARLYKDFDRSNMKTGVVKGDDGGDGSISYLVPWENEKNALVRKLLLRDTSIPPSEVRVTVLNGTETEGLATELADTLSSRGYKISRIADAERKDYTRTQILDHINDPKLAGTFEEFTGPVEYVSGDAAKPGSDEDITIVIGSEWLTWKETKRKQAPQASQREESSRSRESHGTYRRDDVPPYREETSPPQDKPSPGESQGKPAPDVQAHSEPSETAAPPSGEPADNSNAEKIEPAQETVTIPVPEEEKPASAQEPAQEPAQEKK